MSEEMKGLLNSYNEMQMKDISDATLNVAFTVSVYYKQLCELGVDTDTARALVVAFQDQIMGNARENMK